VSSLDVAPSRTALITLADLESAAARIAPVAVRTPLLPFDHASELLGAEIWVKPEMLQRSGAFKFRGAYNFLAQLGDEERRRGVVAPSSGNHAQAVAMAARMFGVPAVVVMPTTVTAAKRAGAERWARASSSPGRRRSTGGIAPWSSWSAKGSRWCRRTTIRGSWRGRARSGWRSPRTCRTSAPCWFPSVVGD
jgi:hypothetical protein